MDELRKVKHLYSRAAFGLRFADMQNAGHTSVKKAVHELIASSEIDDPIGLTETKLDYMSLLTGGANQKKMAIMQQVQQEKELNLSWLKKMSSTEAVLREKMTLFWHNHFACRTINAAYAQQLNNIQRSNALGNFRDLLLQVSQSPAMLQFLNNQQNRKGHPNENFARELMELFTVGRGNYTEQDVKESARAFTGWGFDRDGRFVMRNQLHDDGQKAFLGRTGNFTGEDIIGILLEQEQTARFICNKLYKFFVNEIPDPVHVNAMAAVFYSNNYELKPLLEYVFTADWFYDEKNTGNLIKSPVEFIVGLNRQFYINYLVPELQIQFQRALGQLLFYPPNVAGWPGGKNWIDSSSLMYRLKIPSLVLDGGLIDFAGKADPEDEAFLATARSRQERINTKVQAQADWDKFLADIPGKWSNAEIAGFMLEPQMNRAVQTTIMRAPNIKTLAIEIVSTPEYQLC
ncbi:MAG: DUF1800 domain-containing protein [Bacteroidetes bacterium]|nr:DUF1800 domain-containing protein [Bacteroidota bacterium]